MSKLQKIVYLLLALGAILFLPWFGSWIQYGDNFPADFYDFPSLKPMYPPKMGFSIWAFIGIAGVVAFLILVYVFPQWFKFKKVEIIKTSNPKIPLPSWFWIGLVIWAVTLYLLWSKATSPEWYLHWSDIPLFWSFVLVLDGIVYVRNNRVSLLSQFPEELVGIGATSMGGWIMYEFINFSVHDNWYYPKGDMISNEQFLLYATLVSSGLYPLAYEWYCIMKTIPSLKNRYSNGVKIILSETFKNILLVLSLVGLVLTGVFPDYTWFVLWLAPGFILGIVLDKVGVWTPLKPIGKGDWSPVMLFGLTYLIQGFLLEGQNYFGGTHDEAGNVLFTMQPTYWRYDIPLVNVLHIFEMPFLGYFGYMPFSIFIWIWWIYCATILNIPARFINQDPFEDKIKFELR